MIASRDIEKTENEKIFVEHQPVVTPTELERKTSKVDIDEEQISRAFDYGRELLLSGKIPRLRQLIELYVERVEILPDSVSVTLNILRGLQANENGCALDKLNRTNHEALRSTRQADRDEVISGDKK